VSAARTAREAPPVWSPGGGGWDGLPIRNSRKSASSSWIPAMAAPWSRSIRVISYWLKGRASAVAELGGV
jgi:hypothetical protein